MIDFNQTLSVGLVVAGEAAATSSTQGEPQRTAISNNYGAEIGGSPIAELLDRRIERGMIVICRESLPDGAERVTYTNILP